MNPILETLPNLLGYSVPTILVIAGLVLFFLPFFKEMRPGQIRSARVYGVIIGVIGIGLSLIIEPPQPQPQFIPVYLLPTPANTTPPVVQAELGPTSIPNTLVPDIPTVQETESATETPTFTDIPPSATKPTLPLVTPTPEPITSIIPVWAIEENGVRVNISTLGVYKIAYLDDAYSPWPNAQHEGYRGWTTIVRIYLNRPVEWGTTDYGLIGPINHDAYLGPGGYYLDKSEAIAVSKGDSRTLRLNAGDYLTLVTLDERDRYEDNQGKVDVGITYLGQ